MEAIKEREQFSKRLNSALKRAGETSYSPAALARGFNRRYPGKPITDYAARKWLLGEAIPSQDKLRVLAQWLEVTNDWLRFGEGVKTNSHVVRDDSPVPDYELIRAVAALSATHQEVVRELVAALQRAEKKNQKA